MRHPPRLASVMTPFPYAIDVEASVDEARALMDEHSVHHLPVMDGGHIVGIVTNRAVTGVPGDAALAGLLTPEPFVVDLGTTLEHVLETMAERRVGSVIVTRDGRLAGVFTWVDACRAFAAHLDAEFPAPGGDEAA